MGTATLIGIRHGPFGPIARRARVIFLSAPACMRSKPGIFPDPTGLCVDRPPPEVSIAPSAPAWRAGRATKRKS